MKTAILLLLILPILLLAQGSATKPKTNIDMLAAALDSLGAVKFNDWRVSPDLKSPISGDPSQPGFDDAKWDRLTLNASIYPDSCWIRKEIVLPERIMGKPVAGTIRFLTSVDDYGYLWVNGESRGQFPWDGEFELTKDAKPGQKFLIVIKAINTGGPLRLIRAEIESDEVKPVRTMIADLALSFRVGQKLLGNDTYQTSSRQKVDPGVDNSPMDRAEKKRLYDQIQELAAKIDVGALGTGSLDAFLASVDAVRPQLKPAGDFVKRFTLYFDANAHIDAAWLWRELETIEVCKNTFGSVLRMMETRPDFTYTQSAAAYYDWVERLYPDIFAGIQKRVKDGRWEIIGGMWVEPDCNLPGGEAWMRHLLYGKRYFRDKLGVDVKIGWNPDSFGYNWNMPGFYVNAGLDAFITQKIGWNETNVFPHRVFWWQGPDSSKILCYFPFDYVNTVDNPYRLVDWLRQFEASTGFTKLMILFGVGDHGGGPSDDMFERIERLKGLDIYPTIEYGNTTNYLNWLRGQKGFETIPTWTDELYLEYHQGTYTTQANMKKANREMETLLSNADKFSTLGALHGKTYRGKDLEEAWRTTLFNQFHDILPGSSIREVYVDATESYARAKEIGVYELGDALAAIGGKINTGAFTRGTPVVVYNPLSWERSDVVTMELPKGDERTYAIFDGKGKEVPSQIVRDGKYARSILFRAANVPSMGYVTYEMRAVKPSAAGSGSLVATKDGIENQYFRVIPGHDSGWVKSIVDKRSGKELLAGPGAELQMLEDRPSAWDAWNIGLTGVKYPWRYRGAEVIESGPVRSIVRLTLDYLKPGTPKDYPAVDFANTFVTHDIILYDGVDRVDFRTNVDWWEQKTMLKVAFPVTVQDTVATYEIPYGHITRSTQMRDSWEKAEVEVPAGRWADLSSGGYGVSLLNKAKYGYDIKGNVMRLSLLRSPIWPDPTADRGKHSIEYALYPHTGSWQEGMTVRRAYEYNNALIARPAAAHKGTLPPSNSFITLGPDHQVLTVLKKAEDSDAWVCQWYDAEGTGGDATLSLPKAPKKVVLSNFLEEDGEQVPFTGKTISVRGKKNGITTVKIYF